MKIIKDRMKMIQDRQKIYANNKIRPLEFGISDKVFLEGYPVETNVKIWYERKISSKIYSVF